MGVRARVSGNHSQGNQGEPNQPPGDAKSRYYAINIVSAKIPPIQHAQSLKRQIGAERRRVRQMGDDQGGKPTRRNEMSPVRGNSRFPGKAVDHTVRRRGGTENQP